MEILLVYLHLMSVAVVCDCLKIIREPSGDVLTMMTNCGAVRGSFKVVDGCKCKHNGTLIKEEKDFSCFLPERNRREFIFYTKSLDQEFVLEKRPVNDPSETSSIATCEGANVTITSNVRNVLLTPNTVLLYLNGESFNLKLNISDSDFKRLAGDLLQVQINGHNNDCTRLVLIKISGEKDLKEIPDQSTLNGISHTMLVIACVLGILGSVILLCAVKMFRKIKKREELNIHPPPEYPRTIEQEPLYETCRDLNDDNYYYVNQPDFVPSSGIEQEQEPDGMKPPQYPDQARPLPGTPPYYVNQPDFFPNDKQKTAK